jgi:hypothetical protein
MIASDESAYFTGIFSDHRTGREIGGHASVRARGSAQLTSGITSKGHHQTVTIIISSSHRAP